MALVWYSTDFFAVFIMIILSLSYKKARHSTSQNIHAIRNGERCNVRLCGISFVDYWEIGYAELKVPYK